MPLLSSPIGANRKSSNSELRRNTEPVRFMSMSATYLQALYSLGFNVPSWSVSHLRKFMPSDWLPLSSSALSEPVSWISRVLKLRRVAMACEHGSGIISTGRKGMMSVRWRTDARPARRGRATMSGRSQAAVFIFSQPKYVLLSAANFDATITCVASYRDSATTRSVAEPESFARETMILYLPPRAAPAPVPSWAAVACSVPFAPASADMSFFAPS